MELFDYIVARWKTWAAVFVGGLILILVVGANAGGSGYTARAELLVRPSSSESSSYASDPDRYIDTQLSLLYTTDNLERQAEGSGMAPDELGEALDTLHEPGSESVALLVNAPSEETAVQAVNAVAAAFIDIANEGTGPNSLKIETLRQEISDTRDALGRVNARIDNATDRFVANNPDAGTPTASRVAPDRAVQQTLLTGQLSQLSSTLTDLEFEAATSATRSQVLRTAGSADEVGGWSVTTLLAAVVGWALLLLTAAAAGLALTSRVVSPSRWNSATSGSSLPAALTARGRTEAERERTVLRVSKALATLEHAASGAEPGVRDVVEVTYEPQETDGLRERTDYLTSGLAEQGYILRETVPTGRPDVTMPAPGAAQAVRTLLVVDLGAARLDDARAVGERPQAQQQRTVTVLA